MSIYRIKGSITRNMYASDETKEDLRKKFAPEILARYKEAILDSMDERSFRKQGYQEIAKSYLKYMKQVFKENRYLDRLDETTMMIKYLRKEYKETTQRLKHCFYAAKIGTKIAKGVGLNVDLTELMLINHDIGHTFYGHDGEWMISEILKKYGLGVLCHNAEGPRRLIFREEIYKKVLDKIKEEEPDIKPWKLRVIKENLWIVLDGILTHNGELAKTRFDVEPGKTEKRFEEDLLRCYVEDKADRKIKPATMEGCVLRISDIISYTARDFVDAFREGLIDDIDADYEEVFTEFGISLDVLTSIRNQIRELKDAIDNGNKEHEKLVRQQIATRIEREIVIPVEEAAINDVIQHSTKDAIIMSDDMAYNKLFKLRRLNETKFVDAKVTPDLESGIFPVAIEDILKKGKDILLEEGIIKQFEDKKCAIITAETREKYSKQPAIMQLLEFIEKSNESDYKFTESIAIKRKRGNNGELLDKEQALAMLMTAQFLASLNDVQFFKLLNDLGEITVTQKNGLLTKFISGNVPPAAKSKYMQEIHDLQNSESGGNDENNGGRD